MRLSVYFKLPARVLNKDKNRENCTQHVFNPKLTYLYLKTSTGCTGMTFRLTDLENFGTIHRKSAQTDIEKLI